VTAINNIDNIKNNYNQTTVTMNSHADKVINMIKTIIYNKQ